MEFNTKTIILLLITMTLTVYTITIHSLADRHLYTDPVSAKIYWTSGPSGSLFPWPKAPGMLEIITQTSDVDAFIYQYLIDSQIMVGLSIFLWILTGIYVYRRNKSVQSP